MMEETNPLKAFLKKASEKMGSTYDEVKAESLIKNYGDDYGRLVHDVGTKFGLGQDELSQFRDRAFKEFSITSPDSIYNAESEYLASPYLPEETEMTPAYLKSLKDNRTLGMDMLSRMNEREDMKDPYISSRANALYNKVQEIDKIISEQEPERERSGFWDTYVGDLTEAVGSGFVRVGEWVPSIMNLPQKVFVNSMLRSEDIPPEYRDEVADAIMMSSFSAPGMPSAGSNEVIKNELAKVRESLEEKSDRYEGKDFAQLWSEGDKAGSVGQVFMEASKSLPISLAAMFGGPVGLGFIGLGTAADKYDQLGDIEKPSEFASSEEWERYASQTDMSEFAKISNAILTGTGEAATEYLGSIPLLQVLKKTPGAEKVIKKGLLDTVKRFFSKYGLFTEPVVEGGEEWVNKFWENTIDFATGQRTDFDPLEDANKAFVYGFAGGTQFSGGVGAFSVPKRYRINKNFKQSEAQLNDLLNTDYAREVKNISENISNPKEQLEALQLLNNEYGVDEVEKLTAENYIYNSMRKAQIDYDRNELISTNIKKKSNENGDVSTFEANGEKWYIKTGINKDGTLNDVVIAQNGSGQTKPFSKKVIGDVLTQTPEEVKATIDMEDEMIAKEYEQTQTVQEEAASRGIEVDKTVKTPHGNATVKSVNDDGTITVVKPNGSEGIVNASEVEPYKTQEQKDAEKQDEAAQEEVVSEETQPLPDGTEIKIVNLDDGTAKIVTAEGEQVFNTTEERDNALQAIVEEQIEQAKGDIDQLEPEDRFRQLGAENPRVARTMLQDDINDLRSQANELTKAETQTKQERLDNLTKADQLETEAVRLETLLEISDEELAVSAKKTDATEEIIPETIEETTPEVTETTPESEQKVEPTEEVGEQIEETLEEKAVSISEQAQTDLTNKPRALNAITGLQEEWGMPVTVINSSEMSDAAKALAKERGVTPRAYREGGVAFILSDKISTVSDIKKDYLHEVILHNGLDAIFAKGEPVTVLGKKYNSKDELLKDVYGMLPEDMAQKKAKEYGIDLSRPITEEYQMEIAEEVLAELNELEQVPSKIQNFVNSLWKYIKKKAGFSSKQFTKNDLLSFLKEHRELVKAQAEPTKTTTEAPSKEQTTVNKAQRLIEEFQKEEQSAPYNQLEEWQQDLLAVNVNKESFKRYADANEIGKGLARAWFAPAKEKTSSINNIDAIAQVLTDKAGKEISPQDIVDFIIANPTKAFRKTTGRMNEIRAEYKELTGTSLNNHDRFIKESGIIPEKSVPEAKDERELIYEEAMAKLAEIGITPEQIAPSMTAEEATVELFGEESDENAELRFKVDPNSELGKLQTQLAAARREYNNAINKWRKLNTKLKESPEFGNRGQIDMFGNVSGANTLDFGDALSGARKAVSDAKAIADQASVKINSINRKIKNLENKSGNQGVLFKIDQKMPTKNTKTYTPTGLNILQQRLKQHKDTPWANSVMTSISIQDDISNMLEGKKPKYIEGKLAQMIEKNGEEGIWMYFEVNGVIGNAAKSVNNISTSLLNCDPSKACAKFCYASKGNYRNAHPSIKSEVTEWALNKDPERLGEIAARQYKATQSYMLNKTLRLEDKGDINENTIAFVNKLNEEGVRTHIFSKRPEILSKISDKNIRLLSIDETNQDLAEGNDLKIAYAYTGSKSDLDFIEKNKERMQVVLPVKSGKKTMAQEQIDKLPRWTAQHQCPVDNGKKTLKSWNCTNCDTGKGIGCYVGQTTESIELNTEKDYIYITNKIKDDINKLPEEYRRQLLAELRRVEGIESTSNQSGATSQVERTDTELKELEGKHNENQVEFNNTDEIPSTIDLSNIGKIEASKPKTTENIRFKAEPITPNTKGFNDWFGNSKAADSDGNPIVLYHGTREDFTVFDPRKQETTAHGYGFYFTTERDIAEGYTGRDGKVMEAYMSVQNPIQDDAPPLSEEELTEVISDMLRIELETYADEMDSYRDSFLSNAADTYSMSEEEAIQELAEMVVNNETAIDQIAELSNIIGDRQTAHEAVRNTLGHDGIIVENFQDSDGDVYIAWFPEQIKSATENTGEFSATNPDIRFAIAPPIESKAFKNWFGDSKVVNKKGEPLVVYHGTREDFDKFGTKKTGFSNKHRMWYFTNDVEMAEAHAGGSEAAFKNIGTTGSIMPVYLNIKNPKILNSKDQGDIDAIEDIGYWATDEQLDEFESQGFDGLMLDDMSQIIALDPTQIKSATGNVGTYDPENADIRFKALGKYGAKNLDNSEEAETRLNNLSTAEKMEESNKDASAIKMATGWERGADGLWRYELPDGELMMGYTEAETLDQAIRDEELFIAYPELKNVQIGALSPDETEMSGILRKDPKTGQMTIFAGGDGMAEVASVLVHEIQHAIQEIEGFAQGGNTNMVSDGTYFNIAKQMGLIGSGKSDEQIKYEIYKKLAGETEATNIQARKDMPIDKRRKSLMEETESVARKDQLFLHDGIFSIGSSVRTNDFESMEKASDDAFAKTKQIERDNGWKGTYKSSGSWKYRDSNYEEQVVPSEIAKELESLQKAQDDFFELLKTQDIRFKIEQEAKKVETNPSEAQIKAGNYPKGHFSIDGLNITIENPEGSVRHGNEQPAHYGYFKGTMGNDGDQIDVFVGNNPESDKIYIIDQLNEDGTFDEHKVMLGYDNISHARKAYLSAYDEGWQGLGNISRTNKEGLKDWFKEGDKSKPYSESDIRFAITEKTTSPEVAELFERLEALRKTAKATTVQEELKEEKKTAMVFDKPEIEKELRDFREGVAAGKKYAEKQIDEIQKSIIDYANKYMPLDDAGKRDIQTVLTALRKARTPGTIEAAFNRIDELTAKVVSRKERNRNMRNIKRVLNWMTSYKKEGTMRKGKFTIEMVRAFDNIKNTLKEVRKQTAIVNSKKKYTEAEKQSANERLDAIFNEVNEKENKNLIDETLLKLIELRRNGSEASDALVTAINEDLTEIYNVAKEAKTDEDIERALERKDDREFVKGFVSEQRLEDKPWLKQMGARLNNFTANIMGNWETLMTMLGGTQARDKFSFIIPQVNQEMGIQNSFNTVLQKAMKGYGFKSKNKLLNHIQDLKKEDYTLVKPIRGRERGVGADMKISKMMIIDIYNALGNKDIREDLYLTYGDIVTDENGDYDREAQKAIGKERIGKLIDELSDGDRAFADAMREQLDSYYDTTNEVFVRIFNRDLPKVENYWPSSAEFKTEKDVFNQFMQDAKHPSMVKERAGGRTVKVSDAFDKFSKHVKHSEWYKNMALPVDRMNRVLSDQNVADLITENRGESFYRTLTKNLENQGLQPATRDLTEFERIGGNVLGNWVSAKIGMTPSVPFKQLTSVINYAENMPSHKWLAGFTKGLANPKETFDYMWENVPYLKDRFEKGYSEALEYAMNAASGMPKAKNWHQAIKNFQTIGTRSGDIAAIVFGGKPYLDYLMKEKGMSQEEAVEQFLLDTLRSQQAPFSSTLSIYQNSKNPFAKALFTFANTPSQYMRKMFEANQAYRHGDISKSQLAKIYSIYGVANQFLYVGAGALVSALMRGSDPDDDLWKTTIAQGITSLVGGIPLVRDIVNSTSKQALGLHVYDSALPVMEEISKLGEYSVKAIQGEGDVDKHLYEASKLMLELMGLSAANVEKLVKSTAMRKETITKTRSRKTDNELTEIAAPKREIDAELNKGNYSEYYKNARKRTGEYREAQAAADLKSAYSKAKRKATEFENKGQKAKADKIMELIDRSKYNISNSDFLYSDINAELRRFESQVSRYK